jgi:transposase
MHQEQEDIDKRKQKNLKIQQTLKQTMERRKGQVVRTFEVKIKKNALSKTQRENLNRLFLEAKWIYNEILSSENVFSYNTTGKATVNVLNKNKQIEQRDLNVISAQMIQSLKKRITDSISTLSKQKKKGVHVGKLKFKSSVDSIDLKQFGVTYKMSGKNRIKLAGIKKPLVVNGLDQIFGNKARTKSGKQIQYEIASAKIIRKAGEYYFHITCMMDCKDVDIKETFIDVVGIDFGVSTDMTLSEGTKIDVKVEPTKRRKTECKNLSRKKKGSNNRFRQKIKLQKAYNKETNIKDEIKHKFKSTMKHVGLIGVQNESISGWHKGWFGSQIQRSAIGGIIEEIKTLPQTRVADKYFASTKTCRECKKKNDIPLDKRIYECECGYKKDRDVHSAANMADEAIRIQNERIEEARKLFSIHGVNASTNNTNKNEIPAERREYKPVEKFTAAMKTLGRNCKWISVKQEASSH